MSIPEPGNSENLPKPESSSEDRRQVHRAAFLRPLNLLMLVVGGVAGILYSWWFLPLAAVTYALLVFLAIREPFFEQQTLGRRSSANLSQTSLDISPERRARWLPKGETRRKVDEALEVYRKAVASIEGSDSVTRAVLEDAVPRLHTAADRLVETATKREKAATLATELKSLNNTRADHTMTIGKLEEGIQTADAEISKTCDQFSALRAKVAQISISDTPETRATASQVNASLDELNLRLEALGETMNSSEKDSSLPGELPDQKDS